MNHIWKIIAVVSILSNLGLGFWIYKMKNPNLNSGQLELSDLNKDDFEETKKKNPNFAEDLNDYFYKKETTIQFLENLYHLDTIRKGTLAKKDMYFVNTGKNPFFITDLKVSCGCTIPTYDKKPILPGDTGLIQIEFNSGKKDVGYYIQKLSVIGNVKNNETMSHFDVTVVK